MTIRKFITVVAVLFLLTAQAYALEKLDRTAIDSNSKTGATWDFGKIKQGQILKHEFDFINNSGKYLKIQDVLTSCGCTVSEVRKKELNPGETTIVEVKFDPTGYNGEVEQFVYITTDSLDNPVIKIIIKAQVEK